MHRLLLLIITLFTFSPAYALLCPTNFNQINIGDTIDQVTQQCGKPDMQNKTEVETPTPQEWSYYVQPIPTKPNTLKVTVAFDAFGKVTNVGVNGTSLVSSNICGGKNLRLGDTIEQVKATCGSPAIVNQMQPVAGAPPLPQVEIVKFRYNTTPPATLTFTNGKLTARD